MKKDKRIYLKLFTSTFFLSAFTFGGGYVIVPLMRKKFVNELKWIDEEEMLDLLVIAQASPGMIAVNTSILLGYRIAGIAGILLSVLGTVLPPLIILSVISLFYTAFRDNRIVAAVLKGMLAGVAAVIAEAVLGMGKTVVKEKSVFSIFILISAFAASFVFKVNAMFIILICLVLGATKVFLWDKKVKLQ